MTMPADITTAEASPSRLTVSALVALLCVIWGSTWVAIKIGLQDVAPFSSAGARFAIAAVVMALAAPRIQRLEGGDAPPAWLWLTVGVTNFALSYGIVYRAGATTMSSGLASLLWAVFPLMMAVSGHLWLRDERLRLRHAAGFALGFVGVAVLFHWDLAKVGSDALLVGLVFLLSPLSCCVGTTLLKRHGGRVSSALLNRNAMALGAVLLLACAAITERGTPQSWTLRAWLSVGYLAVFGTAMTFGLYFWLLRHAPANRLSLIAYVTPPLALFLGALLLDEPIYAHTLVGAALVVLGIAVVVRR